MKKLLLVVAVGLLIAADKPKDDTAKKDLEALQGDWTLVSGERNGEKFPEELLKSLKRTIKGDKATITRDGETIATGTMTLDTSKKLKTIDVKLEGMDQTIKGIYELEGETFKMCYAMPGGDRPKEFASKEGSGITLAVWKKAKK